MKTSLKTLFAQAKVFLLFLIISFLFHFLFILIDILLLVTVIGRDISKKVDKEVRNYIANNRDYFDTLHQHMSDFSNTIANNYRPPFSFYFLLIFLYTLVFLLTGFLIDKYYRGKKILILMYAILLMLYSSAYITRDYLKFDFLFVVLFLLNLFAICIFGFIMGGKFNQYILSKKKNNTL